MKSEYNYKSPPISLLTDDNSWVEGQDKIFDVMEDFFNAFQLGLSESGLQYDIRGVNFGLNYREYRFAISKWVENNDEFFDLVDIVSNICKKAKKDHPLLIDYSIDKNSSRVEEYCLVTAKALNPINLPLKQALLSKIDWQKDLCFCIGSDANGQSYFPLSEKLSLLTVSAKDTANINSFLKATLTGLIYKYTPSDIKFIIVDGSKEFNCLNDIPFMYYGKVINDESKAFLSLAYLNVILKEREKLFAECGVSDITAYNAINAQKMPEILLIINNLATIRANYVGHDSMFTAGVTFLVDKAKKFGFKIWLTSDRSAAVDPYTQEIRTKATAKIAFKMNTTLGSLLATGLRDAYYLSEKKDAILVYNEKNILKIVPYLITDKEFKDVCNFIKDENYPYYDKDGYDEIEKAKSAKPKNAGKARQTSVAKDLLMGALRFAFTVPLFTQLDIQNALELDFVLARNLFRTMLAQEYIVLAEYGRYKINITKEKFEEIFGEKP